MLNIRFITAVLLVLAAFVFCVLGNLVVRNIENDLLAAVLRIDTVNRSQGVESSVRMLSDLWSEKQKILAVFVADNNCDLVGNYVTKIEYYAKNGENEALSVVCYQLSQLLEEMIAQEKISLYNLL